MAKVPYSSPLMSGNLLEKKFSIAASKKLRNLLHVVLNNLKTWRRKWNVTYANSGWNAKAAWKMISYKAHQFKVIEYAETSAIFI